MHASTINQNWTECGKRHARLPGSNGQIAELAGYMRARFAPREPAWPDLQAEVARVRAAPGH